MAAVKIQWVIRLLVDYKGIVFTHIRIIFFFFFFSKCINELLASPNIVSRKIGTM